jgi:linoleoyl-CoA desaturase
MIKFDLAMKLPRYYLLNRILQNMSKSPLNFNNHQQRDFTIALNKNVNQYFKVNNISKNANGKMLFKTIFHLTGYIASYFLIILGGFSAPVTYGLWAMLGFFFAMVAVNIGHDAIHASYSKNKWVNKLLSHTFNINGASAYMWTKMHNTAHHTYTNVDGYDEDIESLPIIRMSPKKELKWIHRFQHFYAVWFYGLATLSWVLIKDYVKFFKNSVGNFSDEKHPTKEYFYLFFYKLLNYSIFIVIPFLVIDLPWYHILLGFLLMHYVAGFTVAIIFMLAHVVEKAHFIDPDETGQLEHSWTVHQLYTTVNFSTDSWMAAFLTGGLNSQVEHHLYPNICSVHYPEISKIVRKTAHEFGHPYLESSFTEAVFSHFRFLKKMGSQKEYQPLPFAS